MDTRIRAFRPPDTEPVVALSLRAWAPVFASLERVLGREISGRLHGDWHQHQERAVRGVLAGPGVHAWVAEADQQVVGFVTATVDAGRLLGEIPMLAVDPAAQGRGTGSALTAFATDWLRGAGMLVVMVETGGDPGHAPARRVYQQAGYALLPVARYFKAL
ncbi:MAG TPA: GNAT family N-acetyltransferase [Streptosporangiaceae bacterium]|jgi:GNAT superfamily N-acetyltransferase|nr:GNAT family N-acetyltransferase [Streptosporangiaceae bacterium]